jgi:hypothetical protein
MALEAYDRSANFVIPVGLGRHFDGLGMPQGETPKAFGAKLKKEAISFAIGHRLADVAPAKQGGT